MRHLHDIRVRIKSGRRTWKKNENFIFVFHERNVWHFVLLLCCSQIKAQNFFHIFLAWLSVCENETCKFSWNLFACIEGIRVLIWVSSTQQAKTEQHDEKSPDEQQREILDNIWKFLSIFWLIAHSWIVMDLFLNLYLLENSAFCESWKSHHQSTYQQ